MKKNRFSDYLKDYLEFNNIMNKDFANRIGVTQKHFIDIMSGKMDLSSKVIENISIVTGIPMEYICKLEANYKFEEDIHKFLENSNMTKSEYLKKFNYKYLIQNEWMKFIDEEDKLEVIKDILKYLRISSPENMNKIDKKIYFKSNNDKPELLLLWLEKCYRATLNQTVKEYSKANIDNLVNYIRDSANANKIDEVELVNKFNENGIFLVIQSDIPGAKIRGAFKVLKNIPAIYITYRHKRIADIYFSLLHELAHCKSDFNKAKSTSLVSYDDEHTEEESNADKQAYNWMVDEKYYEKIMKYSYYDINEEKEYPKSFVVYRLAKDRIIDYSSLEYQQNNQLIEKDNI
jgi:hypothetical protein